MVICKAAILIIVDVKYYHPFLVEYRFLRVLMLHCLVWVGWQPYFGSESLTVAGIKLADHFIHVGCFYCDG